MGAPHLGQFAGSIGIVSLISFPEARHAKCYNFFDDVGIALKTGFYLAEGNDLQVRLL
jgi:hypothetical protein